MSKANMMSQSLQFTSKAKNFKTQSKLSIEETLSSDSHNPELYLSNEFNRQLDQHKINFLSGDLDIKQNQESSFNQEQNPTNRVLFDSIEDVSQCPVFQQKHFMIMEKEYKMKNAEVQNLKLQNESLRESNNTIRLMLEKSQQKNILMQETLSQKISQLHVAESKITRFKDIIQSLQRNQKFSTISLKKQLKYQEAKATSIMKEIIKIRLQIESATQEKAEAQRQNQMKTKQIETLSKIIDSQNNTINQLNKSVEIFGQKQANYQQQVNNLNKAIKDLKNKCIHYEQEINQQKKIQQLDRSRSSSIIKASSNVSEKEIQPKAQELQEKIFFLQNQIKSYKERVETLVKENLALELQIGKIESHKKLLKERSLKGLWSSHNLLIGNAYVINQQQKLNKTIINNHHQTQRYKDRCQRLQIELQNIKNDYHFKQQTLIRLQKQIQQIKFTEQAKRQNALRFKQVQISNLLNEMKLMKTTIQFLQTSNSNKCQQVKEISQLLNKVSQRNETIQSLNVYQQN